MELIELASGVGPAGCQHDGAVFGQPFEAGIAIDLQDTAEPAQVGRRSFGLAVRTVKEHDRWRVRSGPRSVVARIDPEPPSLGPAAAGIEHRDWRIVSEQLVRGEDMVRQTLA